MTFTPTHSCKIIEVPTKKGTNVDLIVDADFDETALSGIVFEELYNSIAVYKLGDAYRTNHTKVGSMNALFGFPRHTRRLGKKFFNDYTTAAYLKHNEYQYDFSSDEEFVIPTSWFETIAGWISRAFAVAGI